MHFASELYGDLRKVAILIKKSLTKFMIILFTLVERTYELDFRTRRVRIVWAYY